MRRLLSIFFGSLLLFSTAPLAPEPLPEVFAAAETLKPAPQVPFEVKITPPPVLSQKNSAPESCTIPASLDDLSAAEKEIFTTALTYFPCELLQTLRTVEIMTDPEKPRALAGRSTLKIRQDALAQPEALALLLHELAHVLDLGGLEGSAESSTSAFRDGSLPLYENDPSVQFYRISWEDEDTLRDTARKADFVSGYARHDPFEDFAESLLLYRLHGHTFRQMAESNLILQQKYEFFRAYVFAGTEFQNGDAQLLMWPRPWDITKLAVSL